MTSPYGALPSVDRMLSDERTQALIERYSRPVVLDLLRASLADARTAIAGGKPAPSPSEIIASLTERVEASERPWPFPVINATGVILHTNIGRSPLSDDAIEAMRRTAQGYTNLELDLDSGRRGSRQTHISELVSRVTGADAALVVNNNASAVMLGLAAIAAGKEVIVSRGEAVEIGGGFRIPDVLSQSGATLVEVGTTNRTYAADYESAITERTGALLAVHASNFRVMGFTHAPHIAELAAIGARHNIPVLHDLGSGCLLDTSAFGIEREPMPQDSVKANVGLSFFSGDKLLGGPQAGIIAGTAPLVSAAARHPLARAMRIDKISMAALAATLSHYIRGEALQKIPVWRVLSMPSARVKAVASEWASALGETASVVESQSTIGGGSLPGETLPSWAVALDCDSIGGANAVSRRMRQARKPVLGRIEAGRLLLDPRTVLPDEHDALLKTVAAAVHSS